MRVFVAMSVVIALGMISVGLLANNGQDSNPDATPGQTLNTDDTDESSDHDQSDRVSQPAQMDHSTDGTFDSSDERCFAGDAQAESALAGRIIVVDPGHGGEDLGTVNRSFDFNESDFVLRISFDLRDRLVESGANVCLTRIDDVYIELEDRATFANTVEGDAFVSMHLNSLPDPEENYTMAMWGNEAKDRFLAQTILERLRYRMATPEFHLGVPNPMSSDVYLLEDLDSTMLRSAEMPATLVEASFLSSSWEAQAFASGLEDGTRWREHQIANSVHLGLEDFFAAFR